MDRPLLSAPLSRFGAFFCQTANPLSGRFRSTDLPWREPDLPRTKLSPLLLDPDLEPPSLSSESSLPPKSGLFSQSPVPRTFNPFSFSSLPGYLGPSFHSSLSDESGLSPLSCSSRELAPFSRSRLRAHPAASKNRLHLGENDPDRSSVTSGLGLDRPEDSPDTDGLRPDCFFPSLFRSLLTSQAEHDRPEWDPFLLFPPDEPSFSGCRAFRARLKRW